MNLLKKYQRIVGKETIAEIREKAKKLENKHIICVNSTYVGGGVAELLNSMVYLFNELDIDFGWRILHGNPDFFNVTKKFHNALQGEKINLSKRKKDIYYETNRKFATITHIKHDLVIIHDPQPLPMIDFYDKKQPWLLRLHIDLTNPDSQVWNYMKGFMKKYDHLVVSREDYEKDVGIPQSVIHPAIDTLSNKNKPVKDTKIDSFLQKFGVNINKPIISQISRFDKWKDPLGVIEVFELVRRKRDCELVLLGSFATDDPEGQQVLEQVQRKKQKSKYGKDIKIILQDNDLLVNCLQRKSKVVVQKSKREGFGLTVTEALYKGTPVVASNIGGIKLQVVSGMNGFLHEPSDHKGFAQSILTLLDDEEMCEGFGRRGKEHIIRNFLMTRLMLDWMNLFETYLKK